MKSVPQLLADITLTWHLFARVYKFEASQSRSERIKHLLVKLIY